MTEKRRRVRAIIFDGNSIVSMHRELNGRTFYVFPGGGMEENESEEQCVIREVFEEFGIVVAPIKKVYEYESTKSVEYFYVCKWVSGKFGTGQGEEFDPNGNNGVYEPTTISISNIETLPLMPPEVATVFLKDYEKNGATLRNDVYKIEATNL